MKVKSCSPLPPPFQERASRRAGIINVGGQTSPFSHLRIVRESLHSIVAISPWENRSLALASISCGLIAFLLLGNISDKIAEIRHKSKVLYVQSVYYM
jgi:hypothetical protein